MMNDPEGSETVAAVTEGRAGGAGRQQQASRVLVFGSMGALDDDAAYGPFRSLPLRRPGSDVLPDDIDDVIVFVPSSKDELPGMDEVLSWAAEHAKPVVLANVDGSWTTEALHAYNHAVRPSPQLLAAGPRGTELAAAIGAAALQHVKRTGLGAELGGDTDYVELGVGFTLPDNEHQYKLMRLQSILDRENRVTAELCQQFDLAKQYIQGTKVPGDGEPPWNPDMSRDAAGTLRAFESERPPSLKSVYQFHGSDTARDLLHPEGDVAREWRQPPAVLIQGETGTGKTELAQHLAWESVGTAAPFVKVSGGQVQLKDLIPDFYGLAARSATTIEDAMPGQFAQAAYGVLFLDEIGALAMDVQKALLPFFDDGMIHPRQIEAFKSFLTVIAATDADLLTMIARQQFSPQLRQRFKRMIRIPALHERSPEDRRQLVLFAAIDPRNRESDGKTLRVKYIHKDELARLSEHEYRNGNFRELETAVHTAIDNATARGDDTIRPGDVPALEMPRHLEALVYRADPPPDGEIRYFSGDKVAFHRIAIDIGTTIQETADGALYLTDRQGLLCWKPELVEAIGEPDRLGDVARPSGPGPLHAIPDPWGRFLVAQEKVGLRFERQPTGEERAQSLGVSLAGDLVAWIAPDGYVHTFPAMASDSRRSRITEEAAECLAVAADGSLIVKVGADLVRYRARTSVGGQLKWDTREPERPWADIDASGIARAFLVPVTDGEELWWVTSEGTLNPQASRSLQSAAAAGVGPLTKVALIDLLQQGEDLWVAVVLAGEPDPREAVLVARFTGGEFVAAERPLSGSVTRVRKSDQLMGVTWVRGRTDGCPMLVLDLDRDRVAVRIPTSVEEGGRR